MKFRLLILSVILITSCSQQRTFRPPPVLIGNIGISANRDASWFTCEKDSDCVVVDDRHCALASVNVLHISDFQRYAENVMHEEFSARCEVKREANADSYRPVCDAGKCSARLKSGGISFDYERRDNPATREDLLILQRAAEILNDKNLWDRNDDRNCSEDDTTWSQYCALHKASIEILGEYQHRRMALQEVRFAIEDVSGGKEYAHRLMDFNNTSSFEEIHRVLSIATGRVEEKLGAR